MRHRWKRFILFSSNNSSSAGALFCAFEYLLVATFSSSLFLFYCSQISPGFLIKSVPNDRNYEYNKGMTSCAWILYDCSWLRWFLKFRESFLVFLASSFTVFLSIFARLLRYQQGFPSKFYSTQYSALTFLCNHRNLRLCWLSEVSAFSLSYIDTFLLTGTEQYSLREITVTMDLDNNTN